ncbi:MAG: hypothetical protein KGI69_03685 [Patescibacteria group bacterium]|nr:hypothetical protein [Patescibacteria group bacterium]
MMKGLPKHIHIIGICGVATSALAIAFHKAGVKVTGSDKGFFPPISTELERHGIPFYAGWHPEKMAEGGLPDLVMVGGASGTQNPETAYARERGVPAYSYPELVGRYLVKSRSIVCAGTWGKTSSAALLSHILIEAGLDPSYMFGGVSLSHEAPAALTDGGWSVLEGDEYKSSPTDRSPKFSHYKPTHLLLTAVSWDHADMYPTEASYLQAFKGLAASLPEDGLIVANKDDGGAAGTLAGSDRRIVWYGRDADYSYGGVKRSRSGLELAIERDGRSFSVASPLLGAFQGENIAGCFAMAHEIGIAPETIVAAIASFKGIKRRLERRLDGDAAASGVTVFDDIAHSPEKASSVLKELRGIYPAPAAIVVVFEPNAGGRERAAAAKYGGAFKDADAVIVPRLTKLKTADGGEAPMEGGELAAVISRTHRDAAHIDDDGALVEKLAARAKKGDVIAFLGSHGFRGMIEGTVEKLS